jgi:nucleoid-associated protein YgaU
MRRDTQIGIILGIAILVIIGVFLSTRTSDQNAVIPDLAMSEEVRQKSEIEEIDINDIFKKSKEAEPEETSSVEYSSDEDQVSEKVVKSTQPEEQPKKTLVETPEDDTSLEGEWEGVAEEIVEESEIVVKSEIIEDIDVAQKITTAEESVILEKELQTPSYGVSVDTIYKVQSNDNLFKISRKYYGDGEKWNKIFEANKDTMSDPDSLYVGQELLIPDITVEKETNQSFQTPAEKKRPVNVDTHTVEAGDTLYRLAEKYYDDPSVWIKIYEANEDTIEDQGLLKEGQILIMPQL